MRMPILFILLLTLLQSCSYTLVTSDQQKVLIQGIDIDRSITRAEAAFAEDKTGRSLGFWAMRDQIITAEQAKRIDASYKRHIAFVHKEFDIWHMTWAITNYYRNGDESVKLVLQDSYDDAVRRGLALDKRSARLHVSGDKIYMGWFHFGGWAAAKKYLVVPGNRKFQQE